jgi:hypothetical protein
MAEGTKQNHNEQLQRINIGGSPYVADYTQRPLTLRTVPLVRAAKILAVSAIRKLEASDNSIT